MFLQKKNRAMQVATYLGLTGKEWFYEIFEPLSVSVEFCYWPLAM